MNKTEINIQGMHCRSCEILVEDELCKVPGVEKVKVSHTKGVAEIYHQSELDEAQISQAVSEAGYSLGKDDLPWLSKKGKDYIDLLTIAIFVTFTYFLANGIGLFNLTNLTSNNFSSLPVVFLVGVTAGLSTCMALVGGLVLGASARFAAQHPTATPAQKFKPHLFFNLGRIASYFLLGGIIGAAGGFLQISPLMLGLLTLGVGIVMLVLGIQLTEISPRLRKINFTLPKSISRMLGIKDQSEKEYSHKNAMIMGALTFFLPCGFTQAMQLYAISTGSATAGALTMGVFAIGTAPGLLGVGGLTSFIKGVFAKTFFKTAGLVVIALALFNITNGYNLTGLTSPFSVSASTIVDDPNVTLENGVQVVRMAQGYSGYSPNTFTIKKDIPVKWIITSQDANTCASTIVSSKLNIRQGLQLGENIIEFTPKEVGAIKFTCIMGMFQGVFNVIDPADPSGQGQNNLAVAPNDSAAAGCKVGGGGCGGCGGGKVNSQPTVEATPVPSVGINNTQVLKTTYTEELDIVPNRFTVKAGQPVRLEIDVKDDGYGCMGSMALPGLSQKVEVLTKGKTLVFDFTPTKKGNYMITCAMGVPRGQITVN